MIVFAAGDPGGSRAVLPVIEELERRVGDCRVVENGFLGRELPDALRKWLVPIEEAQRLVECAGLYVFGSSMHDVLPLTLARRAREAAVPVMHVLDNWGAYAQRLRTDGKEMLIPDVYTVLDNAAAAGAAAGGVPEKCLRVTGHPGLARALSRPFSPTTEQRRENAQKYGCPSGRLHLAFIDDYLSGSFGPDTRENGHHGYLDCQVLAAFCEALQSRAEQVYISVLPHPREPAAEAAAMWEQCRGKLTGGVLSLPEGRQALSGVHGVAGMSSILVYEAWALGVPALSMQPGGNFDAILDFSRFDGVFHAAAFDAVPAAVAAWLRKCADAGIACLRPECALHVQAPRAVADIAEELLQRSFGTGIRARDNG